jgi:hypothetical protein
MTSLRPLTDDTMKKRIVILPDRAERTAAKWATPLEMLGGEGSARAPRPSGSRYMIDLHPTRHSFHWLDDTVASRRYFTGIIRCSYGLPGHMT